MIHLLRGAHGSPLRLHARGALLSRFSTQPAPSPPTRAYAAAPDAAATPLTMKDFASPRAVFVKVKELGATGLLVYGALWAGPAAAVYAAVVSEAITVADPLVVADTYLPEALVSGFRSTAVSFGLELPEKGEELSLKTCGVLWGLLATDLLEPVRVGLTLVVTPKIINALRTR